MPLKKRYRSKNLKSGSYKGVNKCLNLFRGIPNIPEMIRALILLLRINYIPVKPHKKRINISVVFITLNVVLVLVN